MSLYDFVAGLQKKSEKTKKHVLIALLAVSFLFLAIFWVVMFKQEFPSVSGTTKSTNVAGALGESENILTPLAALVEGFKGLKSDIASTLKEESAKLNSISANPRKVYELPQN